MMKHILYSRFKGVFLLPILAIFLSNCVFSELKKQITEMEKTYFLAGKVENDSHHQEPVIVILYSEKEGRKEIVQYAFAEETGHFSFIVTKGTYYLAAVEDLNNNFTYDKGELVGYFGIPDQIVVPFDMMASPDPKGTMDLNILLTRAEGFLYSFPKAVNHKAASGKNIAKLGQITDLDDKIFAQENGAIGYWEPLTFIRAFGYGVYFIEPYDSNKIPILFVHGAKGTPIIWKKIVEQIDRQQYQPWFYYYPSGIQLDLNASGLNEMVKSLHDTYPFNTLYVTAHSMGGLVSRSFIMKNVYQDNQDYIKLFVSISTPWDGHRGTEKGVKNAPTAIPSWYDMVPGSEFIQSIYKRELPSNIKFYLFFSFRGDCSVFMGNNDGSVELTSELDYRAQAEAKRIIGFNEDHVSILSSQQIIDQYNQVLKSLSWVRGMNSGDLGVPK